MADRWRSLPKSSYKRNQNFILKSECLKCGQIFIIFLAGLGKKKANGINHRLLFFNLLIKQ